MNETELKIRLLAITPNAEKVIENAGRTSYQSFHKAGKDSEKRFIRMLIKRGHESVLEHAFASFAIKGVSRALTHQLVRHRLASFTQKSQRYVDERNFSYIIPPRIKNTPEALKIFEDLMRKVKETYLKLQEMRIPKEDARFVLPNAISSEIVISANFREWRHILTLRGAPDAQWEIRNLAIEIYKTLNNYAPTCFCDFKFDDKNNCIRKISLD